MGIRGPPVLFQTYQADLRRLEKPTRCTVTTSVVVCGPPCSSKTTRKRAKTRQGSASQRTRKITKAFSTTVPGSPLQATTNSSRVLSPGNSCGMGASSRSSQRNRLWGNRAARSRSGCWPRFCTCQATSHRSEAGPPRRAACSTSTRGPMSCGVGTNEPKNEKESLWKVSGDELRCQAEMKLQGDRVLHAVAVL